MEYVNQSGHGARDISPEEISPLAGLPRLSLPQEPSLCGCEGISQPVMPTQGACCVPTCHPCGEGSWGLEGHPLAMVYAPCQAFRNLYDLETALERGTLFSELDLPIETAGGTSGKGCGCGHNRRN